MEIIISIAAILLIVSLYDHLSSKSWQQITSSSRNDVVFDKRNKEYGAYEIRRNYDKTLVFILLGVVMTIGASYGAYLYTKALPVEENQSAYGEIEIAEWIEPEKEETPELPKDLAVEVPVEKLEEQLRFDLFEVTDIPVEATMNTQDDVADIRAGAKDVIGDDDPSFEIPKETVKDKIVGGGGGGEEKPETWVDEDAEFPGGYPAMMKFFSQNLKYPEIGVITGAQGQANLRFIVEKSGEINDVKVLKGVPNCTECDKEAIRVVKAMPKWKAGKINGKPVRSYYNMPITFTLK